MNRKLRVLIPFTLILSMLLALTVSAAPDFTGLVCVSFEGSRTANEPGSWGQAATAAAIDNNSLNSATIAPDGDTATMTDGCFAPSGALTGTNFLRVKGDDTLAVDIETDLTNAAPPNKKDLTASVELPEGDATGNNVVDFSDFTELSTQYNTTVPGQSADFNENGGVVDFEDFTLLSTNYNLVGAGGAIVRSANRAPSGLASIEAKPASFSNVTTGTQLPVSVIIKNASVEDIRSLKIQVRPGADVSLAGITGNTGFPACTNACQMSLGPIDAASQAPDVVIDASKLGADPLIDAEIVAIQLTFTYNGANPVASLDIADVLRYVGGDISASPIVGTVYGTDARAVEEFANCMPGELCTGPTFVGLSSTEIASSSNLAQVVIPLMILVGLAGVAVVQRKNN